MTTFAIPFVLRSICADIEELLSLRLGVPMNAKLPQGEGKGKARVHFPGHSFKLDVGVETGHYGQTVGITRLEASIRFFSADEAEEWIANLQRYAGPLEWSFEPVHGFMPRDEGKLRFAVEGIALDRLAMNASNRRNGLPTFKWDDPEHPHRETRQVFSEGKVAQRLTFS